MSKKLFLLPVALLLLAGSYRDAFAQGAEQQTLGYVLEHYAEEFEPGIIGAHGNIRSEILEFWFQGQHYDRFTAGDPTDPGNPNNFDRYHDHPWRDDGIMAWLGPWFSDIGPIFGEFGNCFDISIESICINWVGWVPVPGLIFDYYLPEVAIETNNYGIGKAPFVAFFRDLIFLPIRDMLMPLLMPHWDDHATDNLGFSGFPDEIYSDLGAEGIREDMHLGQSSTSAVGALPGLDTYNYEAHTYRTLADIILRMVLSVLCRDCFPVNMHRWYWNWTELQLSPFWRIPELTLMKNPMGYIMSALPGLYQYRSNLSPFLGILGNFPPDALMNGLPGHPIMYGTCASVRSTRGNPIWMMLNMQIFPMADLGQHCYTNQSLGQLYPLVGNIDVNSQRIAPILASRRVLEWTDSSLALFRTPRFVESRDKFQRIFPDVGENQECYMLRDVDERNWDRWPGGHNDGLIFRENVEERGERRIVFWKKHRCCFSLPQLCSSRDNDL